METCAGPGCEQPGTNKCSACKIIFYCGPICQTADWKEHKEECPGHLRNVTVANLKKAQCFHQQRDGPQTLRYCNLAMTKLKQFTNFPVEASHEAYQMKFDALNMMGRNREALECAKEWYCIWPTKHTHPPAIVAAFALIESCIHSKEFTDALLFAHTTWETITLCRDSHIPEDQREGYIALGARFLAKAIYSLANSGGMPAEEMQESGKEAITLTRRALEIHIQLHGLENERVASDMGLLASVLSFFKDDDDDDEVVRCFEQSTAIFARVQGSLSGNVANGESNLGSLYQKRAIKAKDANNLDRCVANYGLALPRLREAIRIFRAIGRVDMADNITRAADDIESHLRHFTAVLAASR